MLRLAILSSRGRLGTFAGALIALTAAAALAMAWGMQLESVLRSHPPVERYASAAAVIAGRQTAGADHDVLLGERARVSSTLVTRLAAVPGVRAAIGDVSVSGQLGNRSIEAHGWASAALTPYVLSAGRPPAAPDEVVTGYRVPVGTRLRLASTGPARAVTVVGVALPRHRVSQQTAIFLTDAEAARLAGHSGRVDAIGVLAGPGFHVSRLRAAAGAAQVLTGDARGQAEYPALQQTRTTLIPVTAAFGGLAMFIAMFVVAGTMGLSIQQREREIALLRAIAATPGQIRRMIAWEATIVALVGSLLGIWPGVLLGRALGHALVRHGIAPPNFAVDVDWIPAAAVIIGAVATTLLAVLAAGRRAARVPPTLALTDAAVEPRLVGPGRVVGGAAGARRRGGAVHRLGHHQHAGDGRGDIRAQRHLPRGCRRVSRPDRGPGGRPSGRTAAGVALARRWLPGLREPARRHPTLCVGDDAARAQRCPELHAAVQHHHD